MEAPRPGAGEVLVWVRASGTNPVDAKVRQAGQWAGIELRAVLGYDVSGVVEEAGPGVADLAPGDEVRRLSQAKWRWASGGQLDRLADLLDEELVFVHLNGHITSKREWMGELRSGRFVYERIEPHETSVRAFGDAAVVVGRGTFTVNGGTGVPARLHRGVRRAQRSVEAREPARMLGRPVTDGAHVAAPGSCFPCSG